jgi:hypothetical protein
MFTDSACTPSSDSAIPRPDVLGYQPLAGNEPALGFDLSTYEIHVPLGKIEFGMHAHEVIESV